MTADACQVCRQEPCVRCYACDAAVVWAPVPETGEEAIQRRATGRRAMSEALVASLDSSTHKCASTSADQPSVEELAARKRTAARVILNSKRRLVGPLPQGVSRVVRRHNPWKAPTKRRARPLDGAAPWPIEWYLRPGHVLGDVAEASDRWKKELARVQTCGKPSARTWVAGRRRDGKMMCGPAQCHSRRHKNCRPHAANERIEELEPVTLLTLTDRNRCVTAPWLDMRHLSIGKRLGRFFNLWGKAWGRPSYVWVKESHESGAPHIHIVLRDSFKSSIVQYEFDETKDKLTLLAPRADAKKVEEWWRTCGGGFSVRWEALRENGHYITGYLNSQLNVTPRVAALCHYNKLRDWGSSKGIKRKRSMLKVWDMKRGTREVCESHFANLEDDAREQC